MKHSKTVKRVFTICINDLEKFNIVLVFDHEVIELLIVSSIKCGQNFYFQQVSKIIYRILKRGENVYQPARKNIDRPLM